MTKPILRYLSIALVSLIGLCSPHTLAEKKLFFVVPDHLGTPKYLVDENQTVVWDNKGAKPFGNSTPDQDPDGDGMDVVLDHRFAGQYYDEETGLSYNYFRYYDPETGRYITSDPRGVLLDFSDPQRQVATRTGIDIPDFSYVDGLNHTYGYVNQNPLAIVDPTGELLDPRVIAATVGLGSLATFMVCFDNCMDGDGDGQCDTYDPEDPSSKKNFSDCASYCTQLANLLNVISGWSSTIGGAAGEKVDTLIENL